MSLDPLIFKDMTSKQVEEMLGIGPLGIRVGLLIEEGDTQKDLFGLKLTHDNAVRRRTASEIGTVLFIGEYAFEGEGKVLGKVYVGKKVFFRKMTGLALNFSNGDQIRVVTDNDIFINIHDINKMRETLGDLVNAVEY